MVEEMLEKAGVEKEKEAEPTTIKGRKKYTDLG